MPPIKGDPRTLSADDKQVIDAICAPHPRQQSSLFRILWAIQGHYGFVFPAALERASAYCKVSPTRAYGAMSFYTYFRTRPLGQHVVQFCEGPTCYARGNKRFEHLLREKLGIHEGVTTEDGSVSVIEFECHGSCHLAPYLYVDDQAVPRVTDEDIERIALELQGPVNGSSEPSLDERARGTADAAEVTPDQGGLSGAG